MSFSGVDVATISRAVDLYLSIAWGEDAESHRPAIAFESCACTEEVLDGFEEVRNGGRMRKYALRLGNRRYPFMKLLFQELLVRDRFFFAVDTHDQMDLKASLPDYEAWLELKRYNAGIKEQVEGVWSSSGVPTFSEVVEEVERRARAQGAGGSLQAPRILIVDDDRSIARGVDAILSSRGYRTEVVHTAEAAIERLAEAEAAGRTPELVLSDLEMPGASGFELAAHVRGNPRYEKVAFLLATAADIGPDVYLSAPLDGFLVKPYDTPVLLKFVEETLARAPRAGQHPPMVPPRECPEGPGEGRQEATDPSSITNSGDPAGESTKGESPG